MAERTMSVTNRKKIEETKFHLDSFRYAYKKGYTENMMPDALDKLLTSVIKVIETQQTQIEQLQDNLEG